VVFHEYVYGAVPPAGIAVAVPVDCPKIATLTCVVETESTAGWVTSRVPVTGPHNAASVMLQL
jgi:hypothetical protein